MLSKAQIKYITGLHLKKKRREEGKFIAEGEKVVNELLNSSYKVEQVLALRGFIPKNVHLASEVKEITEEEMHRITALATSSPVLAVAQIPDELPMPEQFSGLNLYLDEIRDPGNVGTLFRIADWFGIDTIYCSEGTVERFNPKVIQSSMGSLFRMKIVYTEPETLFNKNKNSSALPVYGTLLSGENIYTSELSKDAFIIFGNESEGIRKEAQQFVSKGLLIPSASANASHAESLNVAIAAGIVCSEFRRRNN